MFVMGRGFFSLTLLIRRFLDFSCPKNEWQVQRWDRRPHRGAVPPAL
jgi:hypothetical protein